MKKFLAFFLSLFMITAIIGGCTQSNDKPPEEPPQPTKPDTPTPDDPDEPPADETPFTVSLVYDGKPYIPNSDMSAVWTATDGSGISSPAEFNSEGIATAQADLDGDYFVTLTSLPKGYTYNPNKYVVTNEKKHTEIELYKILPTTGDGTDLYTHVMRLSQLGAYRITIEEQGQVVFCQYEPRGGGIYAIETIVDTAANDVNPRMDVYVGTTQFKPSKPTYQLNDGGVSSVYTKNVRYEVSLTDDMKNNVYAFAIKCDSNVGYPVDIDLIVTRNGDFNRTQTKYVLVEPDSSFYDENGNPKPAPEGNGNFKYAYKLVGGRKILDGSKVTRGDDGYYYYTKDNGVTVPLYAKIKSANELIDFQQEQVNLLFNGKNYTYLIRGYNGFAKTVQSSADEETLQLLDRLKEQKTYYDCCNSDGAYPVNDQLKEFLKEYSISNRFFFDGWGWAENLGYDSNDDDQWLYACGYY